MKMKTLSEVQEHLPELLKQARREAIGLIDDNGNLVGLLAGLNDDDIDDLLVQTPSFQAMIARSRASLQSEGSVPIEDVLVEARARLAKERRQARSKAKKDGKSKS